MKKIKNILVTSILTMSAFTATIMTSCNPDACKDVVCSNGGTCTDGSCTCPSGYEGASCETKTKTKYIGTYVGNGVDNGTPSGTYTGWKMVISNSDTSSTTAITVTMKNASDATMLTFPGTINSAGTFTCPNVTVGTYTYSNITGSGNSLTGGSGSISYKDDGVPAYTYTFTTMIKQ
jgi:hypothetical protein